MIDEYVLLVSSGDWGDEFDLEGFAIFKKETWEEVKEGIPDKGFEAYYGSNEFVTFEDKADYLSHIEEKPVTVDEIKSLCSFLNIRPDRLLNSGCDITYGLFVIKSENY